MEAQALTELKPYTTSMERFMELAEKLQRPTVKAMQLSSLASLIETDGREIMRTLLEEHIHRRGPGDLRPTLVGNDDVERTHRRVRGLRLKTIFGKIKVERQIYSKPGVDSLAPKEAMLNLPTQSYSHELQQRLVYKLTNGSYSRAIESVKIKTSIDIPRRQAESIVRPAAMDFQGFYEERRIEGLRPVTKITSL